MNMQLANTFKEYATNPDDYLSIHGVSPEIGYRLPGFADFGMDGDKMVEGLKIAGNPFTPEWTIKLIAYGDEAMKSAIKSEDECNAILAEREYFEASFWYFLARYPFIMHDEAKRAYELHIQAYLQANKFSIYQMEMMNIPIRGKIGRAFLRLPNATQPTFPVVILAGGIDTWKSDLEVHSLSEAMLKKGMAVLLIDVPGTGECPIPGSNTAHDWFIAAIKQLKQHPCIDGTAIGFYGLSFGGYWATKLAFIIPELAGVINTGGPIHYTFQKSWLENKPLGLKLTLARMIGAEKNVDVNKTIETMESFSLLNMDAFYKRKYAPILNINGKKDTLVTLQEIELLNEHQIDQDTLLFGEDRHVASRNWRLHENYATEWLANKLITKVRQTNMEKIDNAN
jgi:esterase FrsA